MTPPLQAIRQRMLAIPRTERDYTSDALLIVADSLAEAARDFEAEEAAAMGGGRIAAALRGLEQQARALAAIFAPPAEEPRA